jgi:hypothetical protein
MNQAAAAIIKALCYSDQFDFPLTRQELAPRLISSQSIPPHQFTTSLNRLAGNGQIKKTGSYYHLPGRSATVTSRLSRLPVSRAKITYATGLAQRLLKLPFVSAVFLTGTVAVKNAAPADDLDLLLITRPDSLWSARFVVTSWLELTGKRRRPRQRQAADKVCANLYLDQNRLTVPIHLRNLYTAHEVIQVRPLADPYGLHARFLRRNAWITTFLGNTKLSPTAAASLTTPVKSKAPLWLEKHLRLLQHRYMKPRQTREHVTANQAFFHPTDLAPRILTDYNRKLESYL